MNGKYCAQIHVNPKHLVNNFVIRQQTLPKRQFAEVIALPDEAISVTKVEAISYNGAKGPTRQCWFTHSSAGDHSVHWSPGTAQVVSSPPKSFRRNNETIDTSDSDECVDCLCDSVMKAVYCVLIKPYTYCLAP